MPAKATGEIAHGLHSTVRCAVHSGPVQPEAEQTEVSQGNDAGKKVAADLGIRPVPHGTDVAELSSLGLPKGVFNLIPIKAGLDDIVRGPVVMRGHDDVLSKPGDMLAYPVVVLLKIHLQPLPLGPEVKIIEVFGQI